MCEKIMRAYSCPLHDGLAAALATITIMAVVAFKLNMIFPESKYFSQLRRILLMSSAKKII